MKLGIKRLGLLTLMVSALVGCQDTTTTTPPPSNTGGSGSVGVATPPPASKVYATGMTADQWMALTPTIDPASLSVDMSTGQPVVKFTVTDGKGNAVVGLGGQSKSSTAIVPSNFNMSFTLAKLVPGTNNDPSKWVSYLVTKPGTVSAPATLGTYPTSDSQGTMVDNGDGTYKYTFWRDVKQAATIVAGLTDSGLNLKADLGDVSYNGALTHRLGIMITGSQPGTGSATPTAVASGITAVPLVNTFNMGYDFVPAGGAVTTTRDIVVKNSCSACHDAKGIGHVSYNPAGAPGTAVGRNDPRLCVTCHTDQTKYGFATVPTTATGYDDTSSIGYKRTVDGKSAFDYPRMIHQTHMGADLVKTGYNLNAHAKKADGTVGCDITTANNTGTSKASGAGQCYNLIGLPQDARNCVVCHTGSATAANKTTNGDNWKNVPSILACGACHDGINFANGSGITLGNRDADVAAKLAVGTTATGHVGGAKADNSLCILCHDSTTIPIYHQTNFATANNPTAISGVSTFSYSISSVKVVNKQPVITFQITKDGVAVKSLAVPTLVRNAQTGAMVVNPAYEPIPGFTSGPSIYVAYAVPQDGIAAPADFNVSANVTLQNLLIASGSPKGGTLTQDGAGNFTATLTGDTVGQPVDTGCTKVTAPAVQACNPTAILAAPIVIPTSAVMVTGAMIGGFTQKVAPGVTTYVAANVSVNPTVAASGTGLHTPAILKKLVATGYTARRVIADIAKCNNCHDQLGTSPSFHNGDRNDPTACAICHNVNRINSGWSVNASTFIHGIHGRDKRTVGYSWNAGSATNPTGWTKTLYPGKLRDCNQCHVANAVNFGSAGTTLQPNLLWSGVATGLHGTSSLTDDSPYFNINYNYGNGFTYTAEGATVSAYTPSNGAGAAGTTVAAHVAGAGGEIVPAQSTTLVSSPIAAACFSCHDTAAARGHMTSNGGSIYEARATALQKFEGCLVCHGYGKDKDVAVVHQ